MKQSLNYALVGLLMLHTQTASGAEGLKDALLLHQTGPRRKALPSNLSATAKMKKINASFDEENEELFFIYLAVKLMEIGICQRPCVCHPRGGPLKVVPSSLNTLFNRRGCSPLTSAICGGHQELVELLLKAGADGNQSDARGITPLQEAISQNNKEIVLLLQQHGARVPESLIV